MRIDFKLLSWVVALVLLSAPGLQAKTLEDIQRLLENEKTELDKLQSRIQKYDRNITLMGRKEDNILRTLGNLDNRLAARARELKIYEWNFLINQKKIDLLESKIKQLETQRARQKKMLESRLRTIYKEGDLFLVKLLFGAEGFGDLLQRFKYVESVMSYDSSLFNNYAARIEELRRDKAALVEARENLKVLESAAKRKKDELEKEKSQKSAFLKKIMGKRVYIMQARKELMRSSEELNELISKLEEKLVLGKGLSLEDMKGRLHMPVKGKLLNRFGRKRDKRYNSYITYNGINIGVRKGTRVKAIFNGKVLYTGSLEGYGNLVIVGHGNNYHSLYGHLDEILVEKGALVQEGTVLGLSGDSGSLVGDALYLELRHQGKPVEPTEWFAEVRK